MCFVIAGLVTLSEVEAWHISLAAAVLTYMSIMQALILAPALEKRFLRIYALGSYRTRIDHFRPEDRVAHMPTSQNLKIAKEIYETAKKVGQIWR